MKYKYSASFQVLLLVMAICFSIGVVLTTCGRISTQSYEASQESQAIQNLVFGLADIQDSAGIPWSGNGAEIDTINLVTRLPAHLIRLIEPLRVEVGKGILDRRRHPLVIKAIPADGRLPDIAAWSVGENGLDENGLGDDVGFMMLGGHCVKIAK